MIVLEMAMSFAVIDKSYRSIIEINKAKQAKRLQDKGKAGVSYCYYYR